MEVILCPKCETPLDPIVPATDKKIGSRIGEKINRLSKTFNCPNCKIQIQIHPAQEGFYSNYNS